MYWDELAFSEVTDAATYHATYFLDRRWGREPRRHDRRLGRRRTPPTASGAIAGTPPGRRRLPRAQQLGQTTGARTATSGCPTTTGPSPATAATATYGGATSYSVVGDVGNYSRNYDYDKLGVTDRMGLPDGSRDLGAPTGSPPSRRGRIAAVELLRTVVGHALRSLGGPRPRDSHAARLGHRRAARATPPCSSPRRSRVSKGKPFVVADQADVAGRSDAARHRATRRLRRSWCSAPRGQRRPELPGSRRGAYVT